MPIGLRKGFVVPPGNFSRWGRWLILLGWVGGALALQAELPVVAVHDSELTRALETMPAGASTPAGTGYQWWPTNWHYFVMPESVKETLHSDGTTYAVINDAAISAGTLLDTNGHPVYPIVISLACEAINDTEIAALTNYVAAGGFLLVGSSSFTRHPDGSTRGDFALANAMGVHMAGSGLANWTNNSTLTKVAGHRLIEHLPGGLLGWSMPASADEISGGLTPDHVRPASHAVWQVTVGDAAVIAQGDSSPYLLVKSYGKGTIIYDAAMQPLLGHGGWAPGMYAYAIFRKAIEWAFESARMPIPKLSPWPYAYDAAFMSRHDLGNEQMEITNILGAAQFEAAIGVEGDYYFATGTLRQEMTNSPAIIASLQQAASNYNASFGPQNGGLPNPDNHSLMISNVDYWGWGPDEALDLASSNQLNTLSFGGTYALESLSNAFADIEGWLGRLTNGLRSSAAPYFNATREASYEIEEQLHVKTTGEQKLGPFPSWVLSTSLQTPGKRYGFISLPVSDWFYNAWYFPGWHVSASIDEGHFDGSIQSLVDFYYGLGALINLDSHTLPADTGSGGWLPRTYLNYSVSSGLHPRLWAANAASIYSWWGQRGNAQVNCAYAASGTQSTITLAVGGATDPGTAVEALVPDPSFYALAVLTNGVAAAAGGYRVNGQVVKVLVGTSVTNVQVSYVLAPGAQDDTYSMAANTTLTVPDNGVLGNDTPGAGTNFAAQIASLPVNGKLSLNSTGGFSYSPVTNFVGIDCFSYEVTDGLTNSNPATVTIDVAPAGSLFFDNFSRPNNALPLAPWQAALGNWSITNGILVGDGSNMGYADAFVDPSWTNYSVQIRMQLPEQAWAGGIDARLDPLSGAKYTANVYPETSPGGVKLTLELMKFDIWTAFSTLALTPLQAVGTNWHTLKMALQGNRIRVYFDGTQMLDVTDSGQAGSAPYMTGGFGTHFFGLGASFDDVNVQALPTWPVAADDHYTTAANNLLSVPVPGVMANDSPGLGTNLTAVLLTGPTNGTLTLNADGSFSYLPRTNFVGADSFTYQANDSVSNSAPATVSITVQAGPPVASTHSYTVTQNSSLSIVAPGVLANDWNGGGTNLTAALVAPPADAALTLNPDGSFTYLPNTNFAGFDSFLYQADNEVTNSTPGTVLIDVTPPGDWFFDNFMRSTNLSSLAPWVVNAGNWSIGGGELTAAFADVGYCDAYVPGNWGDFTLQGKVQFPTNAWAAGLSGRINPVTGAKYTANVFPESSPEDHPVVRLMKFYSWSTWTTLAQVHLPGVGTNWNALQMKFLGNEIRVYFNGVQVIRVNDTGADGVPAYTNGGIGAFQYSLGASFANVSVSPWLADCAYVTVENQGLSVSAPGVLAGDTPIYGSNLTAVLMTGPTNGNVSLNADGSFHYLPATNFYGSDSFAYRVLNGATVLGAVPVALTVLPALTVTPDSFSRSYGMTNPVLTGTMTGLRTGDVVTATYTTSAVTNSPVGTYSIVAVLSDPGGVLTNYTVVTNQGTLSVTPAVLTVQAANQSRLYGAPNPVFTAGISGFVNGENASVLSGSPQLSTTANTNSSVGSYPIVVSVGTLSSTNYTFNFTNGTLNVMPATLTVAADNHSRPYGAANPALTASYSGFVNGDNASVLSGSPQLSTTAGTNSPVGSYPIVVSVGTLSSTNYTFSFTNGTLTVTPAILTVAADNHSRPYGAANPALTASYSGFVNGENASVLSGSPQLSTAAGTNSPVGTYPIVVSVGTLSSTNYTFNFTNGTLTVTLATLTVAADNHNRPYGAANPALTASYSGFVNGDDASVLSGSPQLSTTAVTNSPVGSYPIVVGVGTLSSTNYTFSFTNGTLTVTPAILTVAADNHSRPYGAANPVLTASYSGFVNGDNASALSGSPQLSTTADTNSPVGSYAIVVSVGTLSSTNYVFSFTNGTLTVTLATLTVAAANHSRSYGAANPALTASYNGFVNGDNASMLSGSPQLSTTANTNSSVGTYPIVISVGTLSSTNYTFNLTNGILTVTPVTLTISADNQSRPFGAPNPVLTASYSGFVNGEGASILIGSPSVNTTATQTSPAGQYPITVLQGTLSATNYVFSFVPGTLTIVTVAPSVLSISGTGTPGVVIRWSSATNVTYRVQYQTNLLNPAWISLAPDILATNSISSFVDNPGGDANRFYRVMIVP